LQAPGFVRINTCHTSSLRETIQVFEKVLVDDIDGFTTEAQRAQRKEEKEFDGLFRFGKRPNRNNPSSLIPPGIEIFLRDTTATDLRPALIKQKLLRAFCVCGEYDFFYLTRMPRDSGK
jgi:hypothetical protein